MTLASEEEYAKNGISSIEADTMDILHDPEVPGAAPRLRASPLVCAACPEGATTRLN